MHTTLSRTPHNHDIRHYSAGHIHVLLSNSGGEGVESDVAVACQEEQLFHTAIMVWLAILFPLE
jgi:hypothetical protein